MSSREQDRNSSVSSDPQWAIDQVDDRESIEAVGPDSSIDA